jgi:hypothetical protein
VEFWAGKHNNALPLYEEATNLFRALAEEAPESARLAQDKEMVESELALCRSRVSAGEPWKADEGSSLVGLLDLLTGKPNPSA